MSREVTRYTYKSKSLDCTQTGGNSKLALRSWEVPSKRSKFNTTHCLSDRQGLIQNADNKMRGRLYRKRLTKTHTVSFVRNARSYK